MTALKSIFSIGPARLKCLSRCYKTHVYCKQWIWTYPQDKNLTRHVLWLLYNTAQRANTSTVHSLQVQVCLMPHRSESRWEQTQLKCSSKQQVNTTTRINPGKWSKDIQNRNIMYLTVNRSVPLYILQLTSHSLQLLNVALIWWVF